MFLYFKAITFLKYFVLNDIQIFEVSVKLKEITMSHFHIAPLTYLKMTPFQHGKVTFRTCLQN